MSVANNQYSESSMSVANRVINNLIQVPTDTYAVANSVQQPLLSPEWAMTRFPGGGGGGCTNPQNSAVALARDCVYGPETMPLSIRSSCGQNVQQLDPDKLNYIKNIIAGRSA